LKVIKVESGQVLPTKGHIEKKLADIQAANNYSLDEVGSQSMVHLTKFILHFTLLNPPMILLI